MSKTKIDDRYNSGFEPNLNLKNQNLQAEIKSELTPEESVFTSSSIAENRDNLKSHSIDVSPSDFAQGEDFKPSFEDPFRTKDAFGNCEEKSFQDLTFPQTKEKVHEIIGKDNWSDTKPLNDQLQKEIKEALRVEGFDIDRLEITNALEKDYIQWLFLNEQLQEYMEHLCIFGCFEMSSKTIWFLLHDKEKLKAMMLKKTLVLLTPTPLLCTLQFQVFWQTTAKPFYRNYIRPRLISMQRSTVLKAKPASDNAPRVEEKPKKKQKKKPSTTKKSQNSKKTKQIQPKKAEPVLKKDIKSHPIQVKPKIKLAIIHPFSVTKELTSNWNTKVFINFLFYKPTGFFTEKTYVANTMNARDWDLTNFLITQRHRVIEENTKNGKLFDDNKINSTVVNKLNYSLAIDKKILQNAFEKIFPHQSFEKFLVTATKFRMFPVAFNAHWYSILPELINNTVTDCIPQSLLTNPQVRMFPIVFNSTWHVGLNKQKAQNEIYNTYQKLVNSYPITLTEKNVLLGIQNPISNPELFCLPKTKQKPFLISDLENFTLEKSHFKTLKFLFNEIKKGNMGVKLSLRTQVRLLALTNNAKVHVFLQMFDTATLKGLDLETGEKIANWLAVHNNSSLIGGEKRVCIEFWKKCPRNLNWDLTLNLLQISLGFPKYHILAVLHQANVLDGHILARVANPFDRGTIHKAHRASNTVCVYDGYLTVGDHKRIKLGVALARLLPTRYSGSSQQMRYFSDNWKDDFPKDYCGNEELGHNENEYKTYQLLKGTIGYAAEQLTRLRFYAKLEYLVDLGGATETFRVDLNIKIFKQYKLLVIDLLINQTDLIFPLPKNKYKGKLVLELLTKIELFYNQKYGLLPVPFPIIVTEIT